MRLEPLGRRPWTLARMALPLVLGATLTGGGRSAGRKADLSPAELVLTSVADSGSYFVYHYTLSNPSTSTWGLLGVMVDFSRDSGSAESFPSTGEFADYSGGAPRVDIGPISPDGWSAILDVDGQLLWSPDYTPMVSDDSIAPGGSLAGFGIRSSSLPSVRSIQALPTAESCCQETVEIEGMQYAAPPDASTVPGEAILPYFSRSEVNLATLQTQLGIICGDGTWLGSRALCDELMSSLRTAGAELAQGRAAGAGAVLEDFTRRLHEERAALRTGVFWLLTLNASQVVTNLGSEM